MEEIVNAVMNLLDALFSTLHSRMGDMNLLDAFGVDLFIGVSGLLVKGLAKLKNDAKDAVGVAALIVVVTGLMASIMALVSGLDTTSVVTNTSMLILMTDSMALVLALFSKLNIGVPEAIKAAEALVVGSAIIIGGISAIAVILEGIFGLISMIPNSKEFFQNGIELMAIVFDGLGTALGSLVKAFAETAFSSIPTIGQYLTDFMTNASGFFDALGEGGKVNATTLANADMLTQVVLTLTEASLLQGISNLKIFGDSEANFEAITANVVSLRIRFVNLVKK